MERDSKKPLEPESDNESKNSVLHNATRKQSSVSPEDYPDADKQSRSGFVVPEKKRG